MRGITFSGAVVLSFVLAGCASRGAGPTTGSPGGEFGEAHWVEVSPEVRTLVVSPGHVATVNHAGEGSTELAVGAFFARYASAEGQVDQLALILVLEGEHGPDLLTSRQSLLLEIDGEYFSGAPGVSDNSVHYDPADGGRTTLAIPVSITVLEELVTARRVRGRIGTSSLFELPEDTRRRLRDLLGGLPDDYQRERRHFGLRALIATHSP